MLATHFVLVFMHMSPEKTKRQICSQFLHTRNICLHTGIKISFLALHANKNISVVTNHC